MSLCPGVLDMFTEHSLGHTSPLIAVRIVRYTENEGKVMSKDLSGPAIVFSTGLVKLSVNALVGKGGRRRVIAPNL